MDEEYLKEEENEIKENMDEEFRNKKEEVYPKEKEKYNETKEKFLLDSKFISYNKKFSTNKNTWWPVNVTYAGKKYYPASHSSYLNNEKKIKIYYYCVNHNLNTPYKKLLFEKKNM